MKRYLYSIVDDDDFDIWFMLEMRNDKFGKFPIISDRGIVCRYDYNIYS